MKFFILIFAAFLCGTSYSQITAVTEKGDTVILLQDGTWEFKTEYSGKQTEEELPDTNFTEFFKTSSAQKVVKGQKVDYELWYDADSWKLTSSSANASSEYIFKFKNDDVYCMVIPEGISMSLENLKQIALINARNAADKVEIMDQEIRRVNDRYLLMMRIKANIKGIKFMYFGYYYSDENRAVQVVAYTYQKLFDKNIDEMEKMLNGFLVP